MQTVVTFTASHLQATAERLADKLALTCVPPVEATSSQFNLEVTEQRLQLRMHGKEKLKPLYVDFVQGALGYRQQKGGGTKQLLAKACGIKSGFRPSVIDATAGLGRDAFVLASLGCQVLMLERSPIVAALLEDGLRRLGEAETGPQSIALQLIQADALDYLTQYSGKSPDVVLLDPMYPVRQQTALAKKDMRMLAQLLAPDDCIESLLAVARIRAAKRVVVKRPRLLPYVTDEKPSIVYQGSSTRFDVYSAGDPKI